MGETLRTGEESPASTLAHFFPMRTEEALEARSDRYRRFCGLGVIGFVVGVQRLKIGAQRGVTPVQPERSAIRDQLSFSEGLDWSSCVTSAFFEPHAEDGAMQDAPGQNGTLTEAGRIDIGVDKMLGGVGPISTFSPSTMPSFPPIRARRITSRICFTVAAPPP
jgi:hypothetical protein